MKFVLFDSERQVSDRNPTVMTYKEAVKRNTAFRNKGQFHVRWILHDDHLIENREVVEIILSDVFDREYDSLQRLASLFRSLADKVPLIDILDLAEEFDVCLDEEDEED